MWLCLLQSFGALPGFPSGSLSDFFAQQPSSSNDQTLAHELLGLPTMSQGFSAKVHNSLYKPSLLYISMVLGLHWAHELLGCHTIPHG